MTATEFLKSKNWFAEEEEMEFMESALEEYAELKSIEFAEWTESADWRINVDGHWQDARRNIIKTTSELYQQFKNKL